MQDSTRTRQTLSDNYDSLKKKYDRVFRLAYSDAGTDLPNRQKLAESFEDAKQQRMDGEEIGTLVHN